MNHPFFYLSIAAIAPFYCILFLSLIRDVIRSHHAGDSDKTHQKPLPSSKRQNPTIKSIVLAHWVTGGDAPATPITLLENPLSSLSWAPSLSVN